MASNKKTIVLGLDYSEFSGGITEVNRKMGLLDAEFKLAESQAKAYGNETDVLQAKHDQLTQKIALQSKKLEEAKEKYDQAMSSGEKSGKVIDNLDKALLKERTSLQNIQNQLESVAEQMGKYNDGTEEATRKMSLLDAEYKLMTEELKEYGDETDVLQGKQDYLTKKIEQQVIMVEASKSAYEKANATGDLSGKKIDDLNLKRIQEVSKLQDLKNQLANTTNELEKHNETNKIAAKNVEEVTNKALTFGDSIRSLASSLGIDVNPAVEALASKFDGISAGMGNAILTIGATVTALGSFTLSTAEAAGEIDELAHKTGLTTDTIQELNYAAEYLEISAEDIGSSIAKMTKNMDTAKSGTGDAAEAFKSLGVRIKDTKGNLLDNETVFYRTIDALGNVRNETEKDALSMAIFGKSAMSLNNLILEGSDGIKEYAKQAHQAGYVMDNDTINAFNKMDDSMVALNKKMEAVKMTLGEALLPVFDTFANILSGIPTPVLVGIAVFGVLAVVILSVAKAASTMAIANAALSASNAVVGATGTVATTGMAPLLLVLLAIAAAIALIVGGAVAIKGAMSEVKEAANGIVTTADSTTNAASNAVNNTRYAKSQYGNTYAVPNNYNGTDNFRGGKTWINEESGAGPEQIVLPSGSKIISAKDSEQMTGTTNTYYVTIDAKNVKEFEDVVKLAKQKKSANRRVR